MMKRLIFLILPLLTACGVAPIVTTTTVEKVPVGQPCPATMPDKPQTPFNDTATPDMTPLLKAQLYAAQGEYQSGYTDELEALLKACLKK